MRFGNTWTCGVCNKKFKKKSGTHIKSHGMTVEEYDKQYDTEGYFIREATKFLNEFYITTRYRYVKYISNSSPVTMDSKKQENTMSLNDSILKRHLVGLDLIAIYFPMHFTKLIAFDIDLKDFNIVKELVRVLKEHGVKDKNMLASFSGGKGYHVDVFLDEVIHKEIAKKFVDIIISELNLSAEQKIKIESRGTGAQAYKLPLGFKDFKFCHVYDDNLKDENDTLNSREIIDVLNSREKISVDVIKKIAEIPIATKSLLNEDEIVEFEEIEQEINALEIYQNTLEKRIEKVEKILFEGLSEVGNRNNITFEVALYLKDIKNMCLADAKKYIINWIQTRWTSKARAEYINNKEDQAFLNTVESAYKDRYRFIGAQSIAITIQDVKEILSIEVKNELANKALRRLYYILLLHSRAYAVGDGCFYMTYEQMSSAGATTYRGTLLNQLTQLEELGKIIIVSRNVRTKGKLKHQANKYKLVNLFNYSQYDIQVKVFKLCDDDHKCKNCLERAMCHLMDDKDRRKYIKGKEYKDVGECPVNK